MARRKPCKCARYICAIRTISTRVRSDKRLRGAGRSRIPSADARAPLRPLCWETGIQCPKSQSALPGNGPHKKPIWLTIDFSNDPSAGRFDAIAFEGPLKGDFLAWKKFFVHAQDAAVATDQPGLCDQAAYDARTVHPGRFERHSKGNTVALPQAFCARGGHVRGKSTV